MTVEIPACLLRDAAVPMLRPASWCSQANALLENPTAGFGSPIGCH